MWLKSLSVASPNLENPHDQDLKSSFLPHVIQVLGIAAFVILVAVSGFYSVTEHWRRATFALGVAMVWLAVLRSCCDSKVLGVLAVRSRTFDMLFSVVLGASLLFLSYSVDSLGS
ncbi:MAG: DUF3017 domain-containing protein [Corynebacterium sp.]|nr:DUF3017 domain-containing protein [Corynebacterium sp.]